MKKSLLFFIYFMCLISLFAQTTLYVIQKGETLFSIAKRYNTTVDEICKLNNIDDPTKVKVNQALQIPVTTAGKTPQPQYVGNSAVEKNTKNEKAVSEYIVQSGDTLYGIARKNNIKVDTLRLANEMDEKAVIKVGQQLVIPSSDEIALIAKKTPNIPSNITLKPSDPRTYDSKAVDSAIIWPVKAQEMTYVNGKVNSVLLSAGKNEKVSTIKSGLVIYSGLYRGFGNVVFVHSQNTGHIYVYSGLESITVRKGEKVIFGDELGIVGVDGITNKPTLNLMVFLNGEPVDPAKAPRG